MEGYVLPGGVEHSAYCGPEGALVLDVFRRCARTTVTDGRMNPRGTRAGLRWRSCASERRSRSSTTWERRAGLGRPRPVQLHARRDRGARRRRTRTGAPSTFVDHERIVVAGTHSRSSRWTSARWANLLGDAARARRPRCSSRSGRARLARDPARRAAARGRGGPCSDMLRASDLAFRVRDISGARLVVADRSPRPRSRRCAPGGRARVGALPRRGARGAPHEYPPRRAVRGHGGERAGVHPLHVRHDQGPAGRRAHARYTFAKRCRRSTGSTRREGDLVWCTAGTGWAKAIWNVLLGPWSSGAEIVVHEGRSTARAIVADRPPRRDSPLPGADRVPADGEARRPRAVRPVTAAARGRRR